MPVITGGISVVQFASAFFANPTDSLQQNLINLAALRMILESHSLKSVFARPHLALARIERVDTLDEWDRARREAELTGIRTQAVAGQLKLLNEIDTVDFDALKRFGVSAACSTILRNQLYPSHRRTATRRHHNDLTRGSR